MTGRTGSHAELITKARKAGWTPGARDVDALLDALSETGEGEGGEALAQDLQKALLRVEGASVAGRIVPRAAAAVRPARARLVRVMGELARVRPDDAALVACLTDFADDSDMKARLNAIHALGRLSGGAVEKTLLDRWAQAPRPEERRALLRALGTAGGAEALAVLSAAAVPADDPLAATLQGKAVLILKRTLARSEEGAGAVDAAAPFSEHAVVELATRAGLETLLAEEARAAGFKIPGAPKVGSGKVRIKGVKALGELAKLRLHEGFRVVVKNEVLKVALASGDAKAVAEALAKPAVAGLLASLTKGKVRFRLAWDGRGRAEIWRLAEAMAAAAPQLVNDPTASVWEIHLTEGAGALLKPRRLADERFAYRRADVPAASKPSLAAALARVAGVRADDVVWDPFCGSGLELVERAKLGAFASLQGNDLEKDALEAARVNLAAAGVEARLVLGDALEEQSVKPTLIVTNPPMGRRVQRGNLKPLLADFVKHAAEVLQPGGRLVWVSPLPELTAELAERAGLRLERRIPLVMGGGAAADGETKEAASKGGFPAELQRLVKA
jgi:SAM-dependent methyltransferase